MGKSLTELDWKWLGKLKPVLLDRLCQQINEELIKLATGPTEGAHARYLALWKKIKHRDDDVARAFNDWRRSTFFERLVAIRLLGLFTEEEFKGFGAATQQSVDSWIKESAE